MLQSFYNVVEDQKYYITQILFMGHLIKFIWITVLASQAWKRYLFWVSGLTCHKSSRSLFHCPESRVLGLM